MSLEITFPKFAAVRERLDYPSPGLRPDEASLREDASMAIYELEKLNRKIFDTATDTIVEVLSHTAEAFQEYDEYLKSLRSKLLSGEFQPDRLAVEIDLFLKG